MRDYLELVNRVYVHGKDRENRTGVDTRSLFGEHLSFSCVETFPLQTTKKIFWKGVVYELLWFLRGDTNVGWLQKNGVHIWDEWADEDGELGPVYGAQWNYKGQLANVCNLIVKDPNSRRLVVNSWNVAQLPKMRLPPCHLLYQFYVRDGMWLSLQMYQRSADLFLGVPFNIASYALLLNIVAKKCHLSPEWLHITFGDVHIYENHFEQVEELLTRKPYALPTVEIHERVIGQPLCNVEPEDILLTGYESHPAIEAPIAV